MASIEPWFVSPPNPQNNSVFYTLFPKEIRDQIFDLAIAPYEKREVFLPKALPYSRPDFRKMYGKISTALLRTCQRIHGETYHILALNYIKVDWRPGTSFLSNPRNFVSPPKMQNLHVYTNSPDLWTGCYFWGSYLDQVSEQAPDLRHLKMTLGHVAGSAMKRPILPVPNYPEGDPSVPKAEYNKHGWGWHLQKLKNLSTLEVEAETVIERMEELDEVIAEAKEWRITVTSDKHLVLNPQKTKREGWHGLVLSKPASHRNLAGTDALNSRATICLRPFQFA